MSHAERLAEGVRRQMAVPVRAWGVKEVCDWAEWVGLGQYRRRFLHQCIGGALLLELTDRNLRVRPLACMLSMALLMYLGLCSSASVLNPACRCYPLPSAEMSLL